MIAAQGVDCDVMIAALLNAGADPKIVDYNVSIHNFNPKVYGMKKCDLTASYSN